MFSPPLSPRLNAPAEEINRVFLIKMKIKATGRYCQGLQTIDHPCWVEVQPEATGKLALALLQPCLFGVQTAQRAGVDKDLIFK